MRVAVVASVKGAKPAFGEAIIKVKPLAASKIEVAPALSHLMVGSRLTLTGVAYSKQGDQRDDAVSFTSSNSKIVTVSADGASLGGGAGEGHDYRQGWCRDSSVRYPGIGQSGGATQHRSGYLERADRRRHSLQGGRKGCGGEGG